MANLPLEVVDIILDFVHEFHRADSIERYNNTILLQKSHEWNLILDDIRNNVPRYSLRIYLQNILSIPFTISIFSPDCKPFIGTRRLGGGFLDFTVSYSRKARSLSY